MSGWNNAGNGHPKKALDITRVFEAPPELVFAAWVDPEHVSQWWGPYGFTNPVCELDARPGGAIYIEMTAPDGAVFPVEGRFHEIDRPDKLIFTTAAFEDEEGNRQLESLNAVAFRRLTGKTLMRLEVMVVKSTPEADAALDGMEEGWGQSLDKLAGYLRRWQLENKIVL